MLVQRIFLLSYQSWYNKRGKNGNLHVANLCDQIVDLGRPDLVRSVTFRLWLMGWPEGWTNLEPLETDKFQQWQNLHGRCYHNEK